MIKKLKLLLIILVLASIPQSAAYAGNKRFKHVANKVFSIRMKQQRPVRAYRPNRQKFRLAQSRERKISPSAALRAAQRAAPGSKGLGVRYNRNQRGYVVKLRTRNSVRNVIVDGRTGRVRR